MANTFTPAIINALATVSALTPEEQSSLVQALIALGRGSANTVSAPTQVAPTPAPAPTQTAKQSAPEARKYEDTVVYVELSYDGKGVEFYTIKRKKDGTSKREDAFTFMRGVRALCDDVVIEHDKALVSKDTYHSDSYGHAYGEHKHGAYRLYTPKLENGKTVKGKAFTKDATEKWAKAHPEIVLTAEGKAAYHESKDAKKASKEAKERAQYERLQKKFG